MQLYTRAYSIGTPDSLRSLLMPYFSFAVCSSLVRWLLLHNSDFAYTSEVERRHIVSGGPASRDTERRVNDILVMSR